MSMPASAITRTASGWTSGLGSVPALPTSYLSPWYFRRNPSAIWLRHELPVHRTSTTGLRPTDPTLMFVSFVCRVRADEAVYSQQGAEHEEGDEGDNFPSRSASLFNSGTDWKQQARQFNRLL